MKKNGRHWKVKKRPQPWPVAKVYQKCRAAFVVWAVLCDMAMERGSTVVTPTREQLSRLTGIKRLQTLSDALTALESALWIDRIHVPIVQSGIRTATVLRIVVRKQQKSLSTGKTAVSNKNRCKGKQQKSLLDLSLRKGGADLTSPPPADAGTSASRALGSHPILKPMKLTKEGWVYTDPPDYENETTPERVTRIENEKREYARFKRERQENAIACCEKRKTA